MELAQGVHRRLRMHGIEMAHLKLTFGERAALGAVQLVRSEGAPEFTQKIGHRVWGGELLVNLRAEADPDTLMAAVKLPTAFSQQLRPGQPKPTHRVTELPPHRSPRRRNSISA
jgi:hypothetical protein